MKPDPARLAGLMTQESERFRAAHPRSAALHDRARSSLLASVPMQWMVHWAGGFPAYIERAEGGRLADIDGHEYVDFCLGDTGAMPGHSPAATVAAVIEQAARGTTFMLPTEDAVVVGEQLSDRFGMSAWQFTLTATDANRAAIRYARGLTGRSKILVFHHCYHGGVDETLASLADGRVVAPATSLGPPVDPAMTTEVVEFNDVAALRVALGKRDIACVLTEPALTNIGIVLPEPGFHAALRDLTRKHGTLLIIDETHTLSVGPGGYTREHDLDPDMVVVGKAIGGGIPAGAYGFSQDLAEMAAAATSADDTDSPGVGGTLAANALSLAAMRATLQHALTAEAFARSIALAGRWSEGVRSAIARQGLGWHVITLGCRAEYHFAPGPFRRGAQAAAAVDHPLERFLHLYALNRGVVLTPFHNMALFCPSHTEADVDHACEIFGQALATLFGG